MKKKGAIAAVLLAGVMTFGVVATAGCQSRGDGHKHTWTEYKSDGAEGHHRSSTCLDHATVKEQKAHEYESDGNTCKKCGYVKTGEGGGGGGGGDGEVEEPVALSEDTAISLTVGESKEISAGEGAVFTSRHPAVATVDSNGKITAKTAGVAKITATAGNSVITCTVIVLTPLGGNSQTVAKEPFSFNKSVSIGSVTSTPSTPEISDPNAAEFKVEFSDGAIAQNVANGYTVVEPLVEKDGYYLTGWKSTGAAANYDFSTPVTSNMVLTAQWAELPSSVSMLKGNFESIAVEFSGKAATSTVSYRLHSGSDSWHEIDSELIRDSGGTVRADILGLKAGVYDVKVNSTEITGGVPVAKYDRSGYAHFNYTDGIGAYNDDGTVKDNALVIYVTDENKDTVMKDLDNPTVKAQMFDIPYHAGISGADKNWNKQAEGLGWWLNNVQYTKKDKKGNVASNTFSANGSSLGFGNSAFDDIPILIRFIGTVTTPEGCTAYDSLGEGGSVGDNGHMARMKNLKNVTLEGVGDDAEIKGWGFHFMAGSDAKNGRGKGFEVRNLTFNEYPEDAVGMEGVQDGNLIKGSVERCWVHNNTFLPGYCKDPAESDKKEGDGSCDFKRGMYFTCSYNYFEYCHKTNLVGSSDSSLQYNLSYHHNIWYQCGSRIPLTRQANVHFYNNYVFGDPSEKNTPYTHISKPALSYVHSLRANCYLFSENNYYEGCKNVNDGKNGGASKFYGNSFYACSDTSSPVSNVASRTQSVSSNCAYNGTSYANFDTNPTLFYYDSTSAKSNCLLDDSVGARIRNVLYSGAQGHGSVTAKLQKMNTSEPGSSSSVTNLKGKGQVFTFSVAANTTLKINATGLDPQIIRNDGKVIVSAFSGEKTVLLGAGTYMVCAGIKDKEITIASLIVEEDSEAAKAARVEEARKAIQAIPDSITRSSSTVINQAVTAYDNLITEEERNTLGTELTQRLSKAQAAYQEVMVAYVVARIDYIGTVTVDSKDDVEAAGKAYNALSAEAKAKVTNYNKLEAARTAIAGFNGDVIKGTVNRLPKSEQFGLITDSKPAIELALTLFKSALEDYSTLDPEDDQDALIIAQVNIKPVTDAIDVLTAAMKPFDVKEMIAELPEQTDSNFMSKAGALKTAYNALTAEQKAVLTAAEKTACEAAIAVYDDYVSKAVTISFTPGRDDFYTSRADYIEATSYVKKDKNNTYGGVNYTQVAYLDSSARLTIKAQSSARKAVIHFMAGGGTVDINGQIYDVSATPDLTITLDADTAYTIKKQSTSNNFIYLIEILPA